MQNFLVGVFGFSELPPLLVDSSQAFIEGDVYPEDLNQNRCLALTSDVIKDSAIFKTKLQIVLKNCNGSIVYSTKLGETREKEYDKAYSLALRDAFEELQTIDYKYKPTSGNILASNNKLPKSETNAQVSEEIQQGPSKLPFRVLVW